jgi:hypothetical protein
LDSFYKYITPPLHHVLMLHYRNSLQIFFAILALVLFHHQQ